ncbi:DUF2828 family protein [Priestia megaterium]|uniref:DUF2828 family protein n=1 Tax=Priestia megaterium TaxID=1404 RepID=UPI000BFE4D20|nr:DUF2828 family protein [Priestia megaterium]PGO60705.1 hypothetical protein CN981_09210 [Priestia megaterium]
MLTMLKNEFNTTTTTNGALAYKSTESKVLDLFSQGGAFRKRDDQDVKSLFSKAFNENPLLALKTLFYLRDIREGQGERRFFRTALKHLALHKPDAVEKNLHLIPTYGRWDDLLMFLETSLKDQVVALIKAQLAKDLMAKNPSLMAKWLPSENTSSPQTQKYARILSRALGLTPREYRKTLSLLRGKLDIVETKITEKRYEDIDYSKLPSRAGLILRGAFFRNDEDRYRAFLDSLTKGEVKVNAGALYPNDIVGKILNTTQRHFGWRSTPQVTPSDIALFEGMWKNLPDFIGEKQEDSLVMADVSGSMSGTPMEVSIALAMYIAERNKGAFHNHFMTFSARPQLVEIEGSNIVEKVNNISQADWGYNTNIESALQTILDVAVANNLPSNEVVKKLYIISDMQFDTATRGTRVNIFKDMEAKFNSYGYEFPNIVFWNVDAHSNTPMKMNDQGVQLVSGFSPSILTQLLNADGKTPYDLMLDVIESERYEAVTV